MIDDHPPATVACAVCSSTDQWDIPAHPRPDDTVTCRACGAACRYAAFREAATRAAAEAEDFRTTLKGLRNGAHE